MSIRSKINEIIAELPSQVKLVAVSKTHPAEAIAEAYAAGQRIFGESRPQELVSKHGALPADIEWHMIGNLQTNKVKYIAPFISMIHSAGSAKLIEAINKEALKNNRIIDLLLELHLADEDSKSGWEEQELSDYLAGGEYKELSGVRFRGVMCIATYTSDKSVVRGEFLRLRTIFNSLKETYFDHSFDTISMGMSSDYELAIECGSNMVRVGSLIFGGR